MKHTPGPLEIKPRRDEWLIEGQNEDEGKTGVPYSGHGILIANVYEEYYAKLFAAAPALLAALEDLHKEIWAHHKMDVKKDYSLMVADAVAVRVITMATGKEG